MSDITPLTHDMLTAWFSQKPTFALMGEFSAGKSTLLNLLLGGEVLMTQVTATNMPVVWMTYAEEPRAQSLGRDGTLEDFDIKALGDKAHKDKLLLRLALPIEVLKRADIIDTPGISDPRLALGALEFLGPYLDFVIWCSAANQAWRQTEKAMWTSLPESLRANSIMALTRADTLKKSGDLAKVVRRCQKDAGGLFREYTPIATVKALASRGPDGEILDDDKWLESHAKQFFDVLDVSIATATEFCEGRDKISLPEATKVEVAKPKAVVKAKPAAKKKATAKTAKVPAKKKIITKTPKAAVPENTVGPACISSLSAEVFKLRSKDNVAPLNEQFLDTLDHLFTTFLCEKSLSDAHQTVLSRVMSLQRPGELPQNEVIMQLVRELDDFAQTPWCKLG